MEKQIDLFWTLNQFYFYQSKRNDLATTLLNSVSKEHWNNIEQSFISTWTIHAIGKAMGRGPRSLRAWFVPFSKNILALYVLHNNSGYCQNMLGLYAEARDTVASLLQQTQSSDAYDSLAVGVNHQGDCEGAVWSLIEATELEPANGSSRTVPAATGIVEAYYTEK